MANRPSLAIIPARKNSKRLPDKNLLKVGDKCLLERSIEFARKTGYEVIVSTDCKKMRKLSLNEQVLCPWLRPKHLATDEAASVDVVLHALQWYEDTFGQEVENILLLQPTSPFRQLSDFLRAEEVLHNEPEVDSAVSISPLHHSPFWQFKIKNQRLDPLLDLSGVNKRSQDLEETFALNGNIYLIRASTLKKKKQFITDSTYPIIIRDRSLSIDVDDKFDLMFANMLGEALKKW